MFNCIQKFSLLHNIKNFKMLPEETKPEKKFAVGIYCFHHMFINQLLIIKLKYWKVFLFVWPMIMHCSAWLVLLWVVTLCTDYKVVMSCVC